MTRRPWRHAAGAAVVVAMATVVPATSATAAATPQSMAASTISVPLSGGGAIITGGQGTLRYFPPPSGIVRFGVIGFGARTFTLVPPSDTGFVVGSDPAVPVSSSATTPTGVPGHVTLQTYYATSPCLSPDPTATVVITRADRDGTGLLTSLSAHVHVGCADTGAVYDVDVRYASSDPVVDLAFADETVISVAGQVGVIPPTGATGTTPIRVRNAGTEPVTLTSFTVTPADPGWSMSVSAGTCTSPTLAAGASCALSLSWTSDGGPTTALLAASSPDAQAPSITSTLRTVGTPSAPTVLAARDAADGVALSWTVGQGYPAPNVWDVYRRTGGGGWDLIASAVSRLTYADMTLTVGQTADYQVRGRRTATPVAGSSDGNVVTAGRLATTPTYDPAVQIEQVSTPVVSVNAGRYLYATPTVTAPGSYAVPADVTVPSFSDNGIVCGSPVGTLTVRDVVASASGSYLRVDWSFRGTCADGTPIAEELRVGAPGTPFTDVDISRIDTDWQLPRGTYVGQPTSFGVRVINRSTSPLPVALGTLDRGGSPASWWTHESQCGMTVAPQTECVELWTVRPRTPWSGTATLHLAGVGLLGETTATQAITAQPDSIAPRLTVTPVSPWADDYSRVLNARWTDAQSGPGTEDIRLRTVAPGSTRFTAWSYPADLQGVTDNDPNVAVASLQPGVQTCLSFRARDLAGNVTGWSPDRCQATATDDTALSWFSPRRTPDWRQYFTSPALANGSTYVGATRRGARLAGSVVHGRQFALLGVSCPNCGTVVVYVGHTRLGTFSTRAARWHHRVWFVTPRFGRVQNGAISFVVTSSGKPVYVDGFSVRLV